MLPTGRCVLNTIFLHADVRARPYRVEDFRDTLARLELLPEVLALGAYQMNHVWALTFRDESGVKRMLAATDVKVKERRCLVIDPANQDVRMKLHWILYNVPDDEVRAALLPYGRVVDIGRERWRVKGMNEKGSTTRSVTLRLNAGVRLDDLPHELRVAGGQALVVVPGRAPQCLRCSGTGHMRRDCKVPRCTVCRRFGHEATQCVRTYAHVTGPVGDADAAENRMDEEEAEAAAAGGGGASAPGDPLAEPDVEDVNTAPVEQQSTSQNDPAPVTPVLDAKSEECVGAGSTNTALTREVRDAGDGHGDDPEATVKRPRKEDDKREDSGDSGNVKASVGGVMLRRPSFKPKPNTTPYDRGPAAGKPP
ncbi:uncharacterized protein LOC144139474 [Haemaphysalis longicornis]